LELGTGFSGEYSGRENIFLGGLMVGLTREEIKQKEDWIIEFSELRDFIDQPFKTYSSGMQARLTFATAVCIDPDILIIDEALAVGDARFQRKSFGKIEEFRRTGRTILLVSHDINTISTFCDDAILLEGGRMYDHGEPQRIGKVYYKMLFASDEVSQGAGISADQFVNEPPEMEIEIQLDPAKFTHEKGYAWQADLATWDIQGDSSAHLQKSRFILLENATPLRPAHCAHDQIREYGKGAYSHWGQSLYFSTSDNSDPRENGRAYALKHQKLIQAISPHTGSPISLEREAIRRAALQKLGLREAYTQSNPRVMRMGNGKAEILDLGICDRQGKRVNYLTSAEEYSLFFRTVYYQDVDAASATFIIRNTKGVDMFGGSMQSFNLPIPPRKKGEIVEAKLSVTMWLTNGVYFLTVNTRDPKTETNVYYDAIFDGFQFEVSRKQEIFHASVVDLNATLEVRAF
jgi:ABC-type multidrug transport system ATPase subunit